MIFDTHAHYDDKQFDKDRDILLSSMKEKGVGIIVNSGASLESCKKTLELTDQYPFIYAAIGVHPDQVGELNEETFAWLKKQYGHKKVVAVGEIGLDYYWDNESHEIQKNWFVRQMELARELDLPVIIHSREAAADTFSILQKYGRGLRGAIHCYSYSVDQAREYVKMGFYIGVGGVVTFSSGRKLKEVVKEIPLTSILLETDCPYLAPTPNRGKRNSSENLHYVAGEIARIRGISTQEVEDVTESNARALYRLFHAESEKEKNLCRNQY